jgi:hypothetical protein
MIRDWRCGPHSEMTRREYREGRRVGQRER